jgi:hypothetical protein
MKILDPSSELEEDMATKQRQRRNWHMTSRELQAIMFVATLILAGITIILRINDPVVWGFLGTAIGITIGQAQQRNKNR